VRHAWRALTGLLAIGVLFGINALGVYVFGKSSWAPELALDLQGGTQIILEAKTPDGAADDRADEPGAHDHPPARRRVGCRRGRHHDRGGQPDRRADPGTGRRGDAQAHRASAQMQLRAVLAHDRGEHVVVGEDGNRRRTRRPTRPRLHADGVAHQRQRPKLDHGSLQAKFLAYDCANEGTTRRTRPGSAADRLRPDGTAKYILGPVELDGSSITMPRPA
jgi:preprotein translocase subunit SecD